MKIKPGERPTAEQVRAARERYSLSQREAAALIYYTRMGWSHFESGQRRMHPALWEFWNLKARLSKVGLT
jgi:DNA-binding transcriptional regulator YiaG